MRAFRYQAIAGTGAPVTGVIEAEDRRTALHLLGEQGLYPSDLEICANGAGKAETQPGATAPPLTSRWRFGTGIKRREITAFTGEMASLLGAGIPIPQALEGLGTEEENPALKEVVLKISDSVRKGASISTALEEHPRLFNKLYVSMVRVGEEAGALPKVMSDLAQLLEHEDEVRGEVIAAVSYPAFVLGFGIFTVTILLTVVLPRLFTMLQEMLQVLPLPTLILLKTSSFLQHYWPALTVVFIGMAAGLRWYLRTPQGAV